MLQKDPSAEVRLAALEARRDVLDAPGGDILAAPAPGAFDAEGGADAGLENVDYDGVVREIARTGELLERLDRQVKARSRALPLYKASFETRDFADELRAQRKHPLHTLLRRMFHENRA